MELIPLSPPRTAQPAPSEAAARNVSVASAAFDSRALDPLRSRLARHRLYAELDGLEDIHVFQQHHVFAVWDFMLLLKSLQRTLTSTEHPWTPRGTGELRRFVNEIVLGEESDADGRGGFTSHFELYLEAMDESGADARPARRLIELLERGVEPRRALHECGAPAAAVEFAESTLTVVESGAPHEVAAAFTLGREEPLPALFRALVQRLEDRFEGRLTLLRFYLDRHIELDAGEHGPLADRLLTTLCAGEEARKAQALATAATALRARLALWDGVLASLRAAR